MNLYVLSSALDSRIVYLHQDDRGQMFVARTTVMQLVLTFVVLVFSIPLILYASPIILYIAPLIVVSILISLAIDYVRHKSRTIGH